MPRITASLFLADRAACMWIILSSSRPALIRRLSPLRRALVCGPIPATIRKMKARHSASRWENIDVVQERVHREAQPQVAHPPGADGVAQYPRPRRGGQQRRWPRRPRHVGIFRRGCATPHCWLPATKQRQLERQLSALAGSPGSRRRRARLCESVCSLTTMPRAWARSLSPRERQAKSVASTLPCSCAQSRRW